MSKAGRSKEQDEQYEERPVGSAVLTPAKINNDESRRDDEQVCGNDRVGGSMNQIEPRTQHLGVRRGVLRAREDSEPRRHFCSLSQKPVTSGVPLWKLPAAAAHSTTVTTPPDRFGSQFDRIFGLTGAVLCWREELFAARLVEF